MKAAFTVEAMSGDCSKTLRYHINTGPVYSRNASDIPLLELNSFARTAPREEILG
jgi:hypothetical protein